MTSPTLEGARNLAGHLGLRSGTFTILLHVDGYYWVRVYNVPGARLPENRPDAWEGYPIKYDIGVARPKAA